MSLRDVVVLDTETTGLNPYRHDLLEVAAIRVSGDLREVRGEFERKILPRRPWTADPEALAINGYTPQGWASAIPLWQAMDSLADFVAGCVFAGHCVAFDLGFVRAACADLRIPLCEADHHAIDTAALAYPLLISGAIPNLKLATLTAHLGIANPSAHSAMSDARATLELARCLCAPPAISADEWQELAVARLAGIGRLQAALELARRGAP